VGRPGEAWFMLPRIVSFLLLSLVAYSLSSCDEGLGPLMPAADLSDFAEPGLDARPWVRWWWPGNDVQAAELERELEHMLDMGLGGVEIQPFDAALNPEADPDVLQRRRAFGTPEFYENLRSALSKAAELGMQVDLSFGSGWPPSSASIAPAQSLQTLVHGEWDVTGPQALELLLAPGKPPFYEVAELVSGLGEKLTRYLPEEARLMSVMAYRHAGGLRMNSSLTLTDTVQLDPDSLLLLDDRVDGEGVLRWVVPEGRWWVLAFYRMPAGDWPTLSAEAGEPFVLDHFDAGQVQALAEQLFGSVLQEFHGQPIRALFTDSFEFKVERFVAEDIFSEFRMRRGYALEPWLPVILLPGADSFLFEAGRLERAPEFSFGSDDARLRWDYALTISELFSERYLGTLDDWAAGRGMAHRAQVYGADLAPLAAFGAVQIPETEQLYAGGADVFLRLAGSAAMLHGQKLVSAESMVWPLRDYMTTPLKMKAGADKLFYNGVNHLIYHGYPYQHDDDYGVTGWAPFSSRFGGGNTFASNLGEQNPFADFLPDLNRYVSRCQRLLRQGQGQVDFFVVYPFLGFPTSMALEDGVEEALLGGYMEGEPELRQQAFEELSILFGPPVSDPRSLWLLALRPRLAQLEDLGFTWAWIDGVSLLEAKWDDGWLQAGQAHARAVLLHELEAMEPGVAEHLVDLAEAGLRVGLWGDVPSRQPGLFDAASGDARVVQAMERLGNAKGFRRLDGGGDLDLRPTAGLVSDCPLRLFHRRLDSGALLTFVRNPAEQTCAGKLEFTEGCREGLYVLDAWTGALVADGGGDAVDLHLAAYGSRFVLCGDGPAPRELPGPSVDPFAGLGAEEFPLSRWRLSGEGDDLPAGFVDFVLDGLLDWREIPELAEAFSPVLYELELELDAAGGVMLDLGSLRGAAQIFIDGEPVARLSVAPFSVDLSPHLAAGSHRIGVLLTPPWRNRLVALGAAEDPRYAQFVGKEETHMRTGLLGPAVLRCAPDLNCRLSDF